MARICIPDQEYKERVQRCAAILRREKLDALIVNGNEADYANPRYFSGFWPLFERAGELQADTFQDVFKAIGVTGQKLRIGIASFLDTSMTIYQAICDAFPGAEFVNAGYIMTELRQIKSENELACLREGYRLADLATKQVIKEIRPGMTELQMVGVAQRVVYENGAEYEGLPMYVFSEASTRHAISRSCYREFQKGDIVQLNLSAKIDGYSAAIGYPICLGKLEGERREIVQFCRQAHQWTCEQVKAGVMAGDIAKKFYQYFVDNGFKDNFVYGPLHSTGIIEVEAPWAETTSMYPLQPNIRRPLGKGPRRDRKRLRYPQPRDPRGLPGAAVLILHLQQSRCAMRAGIGDFDIMEVPYAADRYVLRRDRRREETKSPVHYPHRHDRISRPPRLLRHGHHGH